MSLDNISQFLSAIDRAGELARITEPVKARLEICEIADRVMKQPGGGKALYFENVILDNGERSKYPVVINLFGSMRRMCIALGVDNLDDVGERITEMLDLKVPEGLIGKLAMLPRLLEIGKFPPRMKTGKPASQEIVLQGDDVDLSKLPIITCWPEDGGPYITLPMVISKDPKRGIRNVGMYRVQILGPRTLAMHWQRHKVGAAHWREMAEKGERMPVVIAVGADPASVYSASAPLPPTIDEFLFAGFLRKAPVSLAKAITCDLEVPAEAEFVIEGYIDPAEALVVEGPFGDHTGFYSEADLYPQVHVSAGTSRTSLWPGHRLRVSRRASTRISGIEDRRGRRRRASQQSCRAGHAHRGSRESSCLWPRSPREGHRRSNSEAMPPAPARWMPPAGMGRCARAKALRSRRCCRCLRFFAAP